MTARGRAALTWGQLQGRLAHVPAQDAHQFCAALARLLLGEALTGSGFSGANSWCSAWFSGLQPVPDATAHVAAPPSLVADTLLAELSLSAWAPHADPAIHITAAAQFHRRGAAPSGERGKARKAGVGGKGRPVQLNMGG